MARSPDWESIPMAVGGEEPLWPLPTVTPKFATWSIGGGRPAGCSVSTCQRWHAGIDLTGAPDGALVVAPEDGTIAGLDKGWTDGTRAIFLRTDSGLFLVMGGVHAGSHKEFSLMAGQRVRKGEKLGRIVGSYGMLHFETYKAEPSRTANSRWWKGETPPAGLLNPTNYVERMVGDEASLVQTRQRLQALAALGFYKGDVDALWGPAAVDALKTAQTSLGVTADGQWGPKTEDAIQAALAAASPCSSLEDCDSPASPSPSKGRDIFGGLRAIGLVVGGAVGVGVVGAIVITLRRGRA